MKKRSKRAQIQGQTFVYLLVAIIMGFLLMFAYKAIRGIGEKNIEHEMILFQENIKKDISSWALHIGSVGEEEYNIPSFITRACFVDLSRREEILNNGFFDEYPLVIDSLETIDNNMFLFDEEGNFYNSVYVGSVTLLENYNCEPLTCFDATNNVLKLLILGRGDTSLLLPGDVNKEHIITCKCPKGCTIKPIANFTFEDNMQYIPTLFDASASYDVDDYIVEYFWDFGDGKNITTSNPKFSHIYNEAKSYEVNLNAVDVDGLKGTFSKSIDIIPYKLTALAGADKTIIVGTEILLNGSASIGRNISYRWFFGDINSKDGTGETIPFRYVQSGTKVVTLNITDIFGNSAMDKLTIEVIR